MREQALIGWEDGRSLSESGAARSGGPERAIPLRENAFGALQAIPDESQRVFVDPEIENGVWFHRLISPTAFSGRENAVKDELAATAPYLVDPTISPF